MFRLFLLTACFICLVWGFTARAQMRGRFDRSVLESEDATKKEIERIQKQAPSKSAALNQEALNEARSMSDFYSRIPAQIAELEKIPVQDTRVQISEALPKLISAIKSCQKKGITENKLLLREKFNQFSLFDPFGDFSINLGTKSGLSTHDLATVNLVGDFFQSDTDKICSTYKESTDDLRTQIDEAFSILTAQLTKNIATLKEQAPRAKKLGEAWDKQADILLKSIEDQSAPAIKVADQLAVIIGIFCLFGILMFLAVKAFSDDVQLELIASGQVIQFATVMVLLIVVCVLGMSKFLTENSLGTLLGGIGGYVLSQGVGRAVSRAAARESQSQSKTTSNT